MLDSVCNGNDVAGVELDCDRIQDYLFTLCVICLLIYSTVGVGSHKIYADYGVTF